MLKRHSIFLTIKLILGNQRGNVGFMGAEGGSGAGEGAGEDAGAGEGAGEGSGTGLQYAYPEGFDEKLKGDPSLMSFADEKGNFNYGNLMKSYVHAKGMLGKDKMGVPDETWTDDQYKELYNKLGRPEDIKEYMIENNVSEGIEKNEEFFNGLKESAYNAGLAPKQAQAMSDFFNNFLGESVSKNNQMSEASYNKESDALKTDWGDKYDHKIQRAFSALEQFASKEEIKGLADRGLLKETSIVRLFDKIANGMAEDSLKVEGGSTFGITGEEAAREIESYYKPGHPFVTRGHPEQKFYQEKMQKLQRVKLSSRRS